MAYQQELWLWSEHFYFEESKSDGKIFDSVTIFFLHLIS